MVGGARRARSVAPCTTTYDVIVVGARCAGSPTAMLLARAGHRVLLVDRATFPSDTMSTHLLHPPAVAALARWGLLDRLEATGCPPIETVLVSTSGPSRSRGRPRPVDGTATAYGPRRTVLDALLVDAAASAGAEVREGFTVDEVLVEDGRVTGIRAARSGHTVTERARVVVGADGRNSLVAKAVQPEHVRRGAARSPPCTTPTGAASRPTASRTYVRAEHGRGWAVLPDQRRPHLRGAAAGRSRSSRANRKDVEGTYLRTFELVPEFAERIGGGDARRRGLTGTGTCPASSARRTARAGRSSATPGTTSTRSRRSASPTRSATRRSSRPAFGSEDAMAAWQRARDEESLPMYRLTADFATLEPPRARDAGALRRDARRTRRRWTTS